MQYSEITIAAWTGTIGGTGLREKGHSHAASMSSYDHRLEKFLPDLAEGGYVVDLLPLAEHKELSKWVMQSPMTDGRVEGDEIDRLSDATREGAAFMAPGLGGEFQTLAVLAASKWGEDGKKAGPFDYVSAAYRAAYWLSKGARIGKRQGNRLVWSDGTEQVI